MPQLAVDGVEEDREIASIAQSRDPNQKLANRGFGSGRFISAGEIISYRIDFENDATATAPAQRVVITDRLDPLLVWDSVAFTGFGFGDVFSSLPPGARHFFDVVYLDVNGRTIAVEVELTFRPSSGEIVAVFQSLDPATGLPPDVLTGFLPPEDGSGRGLGYLTFTVRPKAVLPSGTRIKNIAYITFDDIETIATNQIDPHDPAKGTDPEREAFNTIDAGGPTSSVNPLPGTTTTSQFAVSWGGQDDAGGSGIDFFDVYVSDDGGAYSLWQARTQSTSALFLGVNGHTYRFYSVATDGVGHVQPTPGAAQATTTLNVAANEPPVNQIQSHLFATLQNTFTNWVGWMSISDANAGSGNVRVTLTVSQGILSVSYGQTGGVTASQVTGDDTSTVVITAPLAAINATFAGNAGIRFTPTTGFSGNVTFTMTTNDQFPGNAIIDTDQIVFPVYGNSSEFSESITSGNWTTVQADGTSTAGSSATRAHHGLLALAFTTTSGGLAGPLYKPNGGAHWDLRDKTHLIFWEYGINANTPTWQGNQPQITVFTATGNFTLIRQQEAWPLQTWVYYEVPLAGDGMWTMGNITGTPALDDVLGIQILHDTWGNGFTVYMDGVAFVRKTGSFTNQAPTFASGLSLRLNDLPTNPASNVGTTVSQILASSGSVAILDADGVSLRGIAVTAVNNANGNWQYSVDGGVNWIDLSDVNITAARLLSADSLTRIRFVPNANYAGTVDPGITFVAWDRTFGTAGRMVNVTTRGGGTAYSQTTQTAKITVVAPNVAPVNAIQAALFAAFKDTTANWGGWIDVADPDSTSGNFRFTLQVSTGTLTCDVAVANGVSSGQVSGFGTSTMTFTAPLAAIQTTLRSARGVRFKPTDGFVGSVMLTVTANDLNASSPLSDVDAFAFPIYDANEVITDQLLGSGWPWSASYQSDEPFKITTFSWPLLGAVDNRHGGSKLQMTTSANYRHVTQVAAPGVGHWDVRDKTHLVFWEKPQNSGSFQGNQPIVRLITPTGTITLTRLQVPGSGQWILQEAPLMAANADWSRTVTGIPDLSNITSIEIGHDSSVNGFSMSYDGLAFVRKTGSTTNVAPTFANVNPFSLGTRYSAGSSVGMLVADLLSSGGSNSIADGNGSALRGIAIIAVNTTLGAWSYSLDNGATWQGLASLSNSNAQLLSADSTTRIRFTPNSGVVGTIDPGITFVAWDRTIGTAGLTADASNRGGTTAFSSESRSARIRVMAANAPAIGNTLARNQSTGDWWDVSAASGESSKLLGNWATSGNWVDILTADFNGDGQDDIAGRDSLTGKWQVSIISENVFSTSEWARWTVEQNPPALALHWADVRTGDFNRDGLADIAGRWLETGQWWVNISTGTGFMAQYWGAWTGTNTGAAVTWTGLQVGDYNGDGRSDIFGRWLETGQWWIASSNGSQFSNAYFTSWTAPYFGVTWVDVRVADFNGDGRSDVVGRWLEGGQWWAALSNGVVGVNTNFGTWETSNFGWDNVRIGDFNNDGRSDIVARRVETGDLWVGLSNGSGLVRSIWGRYETSFGWTDIAAADFNGDGRTDLRARRSDSRLRTNHSLATAFDAGSFGELVSTSLSQFQTTNTR